jgi:hypothetical protein
MGDEEAFLFFIRKRALAFYRVRTPSRVSLSLSLGRGGEGYKAKSLRTLNPY